MILKLSHALDGLLIALSRLHSRKHKCASCWMKDHWTLLLSDIVAWDSFWHGTHYLFSDIDAVTVTFHVLVIHISSILLIVLRTLVNLIYLVIFNNFLVFNCPFFSFEQEWAIPEKKKQGGWGYGIFRGIKEIACGISRSYLKMKWNFQGWPRKISMEFPGVLVVDLGISNGSYKNLWNFQEWSFVLSVISTGKVKKWKIPGRFSKKCVLDPLPCLVFFWNGPISFPLDNYSLLIFNVVLHCKLNAVKIPKMV